MDQGAHSVPEAAAGILYQLERALYWLATCSSDACVGVETDDDVAVHDPAAADVSEQDKLSLQTTGHPFQDRSKGLWNTLGIWLKDARDGLPGQRLAELHLVTNRPVPSDCLAREIAKPAKTDTEMAACVLKLRLTGTDPPEALAKTMKAVCAFSDDDIKQVFGRVRLYDAADGTEGAALRKKTVSALHLPPDDDSEGVAQALLGWLHHTLREAWRTKVPGWISRTAFDRQLDAVLRQRRADRKRERAEGLVTVSEEERSAARTSAFVERLIEVEIEDGDILRSIESYVRFSTECFRLNTLGDIAGSDWDSFYSHLEGRWDSILRRVLRNKDPGDRAEKLGQDIFFETAEREYLAPLAGRTTEQFYFTRGGYHRLVEADRVWWHPKHCVAAQVLPSGMP